MPSMREITVEVEANAHAPRISRTQLKDMRPELGSRFDDVALVLSELVSNSVRHGTDNSAVSVVVGASDGRVKIQVTDTGPCFEVDAPRGDGLGLDIVDQIADRWGVDKNGACTVWAEIALD